MKPEQFIREYGVKKAREVVEGAPSNAESYQCGYYFIAKPEFQFHNGFHPVWNSTDNNGEYFKKRGFNPIDLSDLKRLVESVDLVKEHCSLDRAIKYANSPYTTPEIKVCLLDAIADYKSIYGGEHV